MSSGRPASSSARLPATSENMMLRSRRRRILRDTSSPGSKSFTSPAIRVAQPSQSNDSIALSPDLPAQRLSKNVSRSWPTEETTPMPVTTIRFCTRPQRRKCMHVRHNTGQGGACAAGSVRWSAGPCRQRGRQPPLQRSPGLRQGRAWSRHRTARRRCGSRKVVENGGKACMVAAPRGVRGLCAANLHACAFDAVQVQQQDARRLCAADLLSSGHRGAATMHRVTNRCSCYGGGAGGEGRAG